MKITDLFREKADKAKTSAASALEATSAAKDKAAAAKDKAAEAKQKAAEIREKFAPAIRDLTEEAGSLAKEAESELKYLAEQRKSGGFGALINGMRFHETFGHIVAISPALIKPATARRNRYFYIF